MTTNTKELLNVFLNAKSESTRKTYIDRILAIKKLVYYEPDNLSFLEDHNKIIKFIDTSDTKSATKALSYIALSVVTALIGATNKDIYHNKMMEFKNINMKERQDNIINEEIKEHWATSEELKKMYYEMPETTPEEIQDKAILSLYILQPPLRNDYAKIKILNRSPRKENFENYIVVTKSKIEFCINQHKTADNYGAISLNYDDNHHPEIYRILKKWLEHNKTNYLFIRESTQRTLNENDMTKKIPLIFEKHIKKHITIQLLRQIYETEEQNKESYINGTLKDRIAVHEQLKHSHGVAMEYRKLIKKNSPKKETII